MQKQVRYINNKYGWGDNILEINGIFTVVAGNKNDYVLKGIERWEFEVELFEDYNKLKI